MRRLAITVSALSVLLLAACAQPGLPTAEDLPDVFSGVREGSVNPQVREVCDDTLKAYILTPPAPAEPQGVVLVKVSPGYTLETQRPHRL